MPDELLVPAVGQIDAHVGQHLVEIVLVSQRLDDCGVLLLAPDLLQLRLERLPVLHELLMCLRGLVFLLFV